MVVYLNIIFISFSTVLYKKENQENIQQLMVLVLGVT